MFTAAIYEAEIRHGLAHAPGRKRDDLIARITTFYDPGFQDQILPFDRLYAVP